MADSKITGLTALTTVADADVLAIVDDVAGTPVTKKITKANLFSGTVDTSGTPVANDIARFTDSDTVEGRSYAELKADLSLEIGTDVQAHATVLDNTTASFLTADETKLDGIEALADVTDATNVTAAGALMDSELASIADVKALDQSVISGATPTFTTTNFTDAPNKRLMSDAQETKLDSVESSADVTDTTNVTSAGALMDSEVDADIKTLTIAASSSISGANTGDEAAASLTVAGVVELATAAETDTGSDATRAVTPDGLQASKRNIRWLSFNLVEASTDNATATNIAGDFVSPIAGTILQSDTTPFYLYATNSTAGTTGTMVVDISIGGTSIMTTNKLDFDTTEKTTTTGATKPDLTTTALAVGDIITIDIDAVHTTAAKGLTVYMAVRES